MMDVFINLCRDRRGSEVVTRLRLMFLRRAASNEAPVSLSCLAYATHDANEAAYLILVATRIQNCPSMTPPAGKSRVFRLKRLRR